MWHFYVYKVKGMALDWMFRVISDSYHDENVGTTEHYAQKLFPKLSDYIFIIPVSLSLEMERFKGNKSLQFLLEHLPCNVKEASFWNLELKNYINIVLWGGIIISE
jgi:hypothetical protein